MQEALPENYGVVRGVFEHDKGKWYPVIRTNPNHAWEWWYFTPEGVIREYGGEMKFMALSFADEHEAGQFCLEHATKTENDTRKENNTYESREDLR